MNLGNLDDRIGLSPEAIALNTLRIEVNRLYAEIREHIKENGVLKLRIQQLERQKHG